MLTDDDSTDQQPATPGNSKPPRTARHILQTAMMGLSMKMQYQQQNSKDLSKA